MAKYMGKSSDEIWKTVMGNKQQPGKQEQTAAQTGAKTGTSGGRYSGMSADDIWKSVMEGGGQETGQTGLGTVSSDTGTGYQKWLRDYNTVSNKYYSWAKKNSGEGKWQADSFGGTKEAMESLLDQYDDISHRLDEKDKTQFQKAYDGLKQTYDALSESGKYYAQFRDQDDYDRTRSGYTNFGVGYAAESYGLDDGQARALRQEQVQKDARERQRALAEYVAAKKEFDPVDKEYRLYDMTKDEGYSQVYSEEKDEEIRGRWKAAKDKVTKAENALLNARNRMDAYNATWGKIDKYADTTEAAKGTDTSYTGPSYDELNDWENKRQEEQTREEIRANQYDYAPGELTYTTDKRPEAEDRLGLWLSMTQEQRQLAAQSASPALQTLAAEADSGLWNALEDTEIQTYYYLRNSQGQAAANQYLSDMEPELNRRTDEKFIEKVQNASTAARWGYEAEAHGLALVGNVTGFAGELNEMITGDHKVYSSTSRATRYASYIRGINGQSASKFVQDVVKSAGASEDFAAGAAKYAENIYQAVNSGVDSAIGAKLLGPAYLATMGMGAFAQRSEELELRGATNRQIAMGAVGAGCIEMLFEKVSLDHFFENFIKTPPKDWKELVKKTLIQAAVEGDEEVNTEIANIAFDAINMGKNCDVSMAVRGYVLQGMDEKEARRKATMDAITEIYWAGFGGFVSGGAMAGFGHAMNSTINKARNAVSDYAVGDTLMNNGRYVDLQEQASALQDQRKAGKLAKRAQEVTELARQGDNSYGNTYRMGKVATQIAQQAGREASRAEVTEFRAAAEKYLAGQRDIQHKKLALNVLTRAYEGTTMVPGDRAYMRMIQGDKLTQNILDSIGGKETLQENAKAREAASMRTAASVQGSVLGIEPTQERAAYDSDNSGQAYLKDSKDPVNIRGIAEVKDGQLYVATDEGQTVKASDVSFGSYGEAALYSTISNMHTDTQKARSLLYGLDSSGMSTQAYATALQNAYNKGMSGVSYEGIQDYSYAAKLSDDVRRQAWEAGRDRRAVKTGEQAAKVDSGTLVNREKGLTIQDSAKEIVRDSGKMNEQQKAGVAAAKVLAEAGLHIEVYASTESERQNGAPNGIYRSSDGTIHIDLNAGDNGQGTVAYALAHETTHFIKDFSATKYQTYADILIEAAESKGFSYDSLLDRQLAKQSALEENRGKTAEELQQLAYDETIAEMSETMLTDTDAAQRVSQELYKQDRTLWEKIKDFFTGLVEKLRNAYKGVNPDSDIGRVMKRAIQDNETVAQAWAEAVVEAGENYQLQDGQKNNARAGERFSTRQNKRTVAEMETVASVPGYEGSLKASDVIQTVSEFFDSIGNTAENEELGSVILRKRGIKDDISHGIGREKAAAFMAVPDVLKYGKVVDYQENWKGRGYDTAVVAAPIQISGEDYIAGVCVKRTSGDNKFYVHEVLSMKEGATPFNRAALETSVDSGGDTPSMNTILSELLNVKGNLKFSNRNSQESQVERLARKNEELKAEAEYLKQVVQIQKRGNSRNLLDRESVNGIAKGILESVNAKDTEFGKKLNDFYRALQTENMDYSEMQKRAGELADRVLEHHQAERDGYAQEVLDFLKKRRVSLTDSQIGDAEYTYGSLNEFKKAIRGSIIIDQNSTTSLDQLWQEAAAQFPDRFSADTVAADMPDGIANVVSWATNAEADSETEFQYYKAETKADLTQKILMGFLDAKPVESVSDTLKQQMADLKKQHQQEMRELRKSWDAEAKAMEQSHKYDLEAERKRGEAAVEALKYQQEAVQKAQKGLWETERADIKRSYEKQMKELREQNTQKAHEKVESRHRTEERHKLQNTVDTLNRLLLNPTNTSHVPQELQSSVAMAMKVINGAILDSKAGQNADRLAKYAEQLQTLEKDPEGNAEKIADLNRKIGDLTGRDISMKAALNSLQEQYAKLEGQDGGLYDENIEALIEDAKETIGNTAYKDLSLDQLKAVRDTYTALLTTIRNANKAFVAGQNARIDEMVKRATMELSLKNRKKPTQTAMGKKIDQFFWNNEKPVYAFERIGSAVMSELYNNLRKGEDTFYRDVNSARDFFLGAAEKNGFDKWDLNELQEFEASNGQKFQLSLDERMSLYAYSLRPQARDHLTKGGIVLAENTKRLQRGPLGVTREVTYDDANAYTLTDETIDAIVGSLTKEQRQFAFEMQQYLAKVMGAKGDEVNMAMYGIKKFGEETYWPLKSSGVFSERIREQQERTGNKVKNSGFTKALTQHANNAIELSSLTETWAQHVNDMSMYHAFTLPMEDFYRVYNWTQKGDSKGKQTMGVRQMIQQTAGKGAVTYIDQFLKDLNGGLRADPRETVEKALVSSFKKAAVGASLSVAIQQPSAVGRALAYIEANYFVGSKVESAGGIKETWEQLKKYAAVAGLKEMGRFDVDMGQSTLEYIIGRNSVNAWGKFTDKVDELSGWLPEMADQVTWCGIWEAAKRKTAAMNPGLKGEALLQKAGELFTDTITRTQVYDSVFSRSSNMRAKTGIMSMVTSFMAEPTTTANMVEDAVRKFARGDKRMAGKVMSSVAVATVLNAALASVVYAARDDDEDKTYWEKYMASLAGETVDSFNPLTYVPVLADINNLLLGYSIERTDMALASDLVTDLKKLVLLYKKFDPEWDEEEKKEWEKKVRDAWMDNVWMAGTVMGLPLKNVVRDVEAVINTAKNPSNGADMSADTVLKGMKDSARKSLPILSWKADESNSDQLYKAITQGKDVLARRLKAQYGDEKKYESAILKGLRENDPRIKEAAQYALDGKTPERVAIIRKIVAEGHFTQDQVIKAINQKANSMKESSGSEKSSAPQKLYDYDEYVNAAANGLGYAGDVQKELIRYQADRNQEKDGKLTREEAEEASTKTFKSRVKSEAKDGYEAGDLTEAQVRKVLETAGIAEGEELDDLILQWDTELELGSEINWSNARYLEYAETIQPAGISAEDYDNYIRATFKMNGIDENGDGKKEITKQAQVIEYIDSMPISDEQKDILFQAEYPNARKSVLRKLPWR